MAALAMASPVNFDFEFIRDIVRRGSAIVLEPSKDYLVEARLGPLARTEGFASITALIARLRAEGDGPLRRKVIDAMTTNETLFFRDQTPFEVLRQKLLPEILAKRSAKRELRIWSAACSSGQEPYTIAMLLRESFPQLTSWKIEILATDLSSTMLAKARQGLYGRLEVNRGLPTALLAKYFAPVGLDYQIRDELRAMITFREMNLAESWPGLGTFDIVFLRNVLIYFDVPTKKSILSRARQQLAPDGYLFLGAAETTLNLDDRFERVPFERSGCYRVAT
jgi:chemotaxis protein methyltransferase CheR